MIGDLDSLSEADMRTLVEKLSAVPEKDLMREINRIRKSLASRPDLPWWARKVLAATERILPVEEITDDN